jgi:excisionase family DNA binding protein
MLMSNENDRSNIPGYVSIKEAARILGISANRVYAYVEEGRLPSAKAAHVIMIPLEAVEDFKPQLSGRPRTSVPVWRISPEENTLLATSMLVQIRTHQHAKLITRLEEVRREKQHLFPGTIARYMIEKQRQPEHIEILLIWRNTAMPDEATFNRWLNEFQEALGDVLDWETAQYDTGRVIMHT